MGILNATDLITPDITRIRQLFVNLYLVGTTDDWVLVDAGLPKGKKRIIQAARMRFGNRTGPRAIVLTHGHVDHLGSLKDLIKRKDHSVCALHLELPHLTGRADDPPMEPRAGGGALALLSITYPTGPINLHGNVPPLPDDGAIPEMPGWRWVHTPGHTAGHVSLFRDSDRALIAGDAFVTTEKESLLSVATQRKAVSGDWRPTSTGSPSPSTVATPTPRMCRPPDERTRRDPPARNRRVSSSGMRSRRGA